MSERVQKILSQWGVASRRQTEKMIVEGRVKIDGVTAKLGDKVDLTKDLLEVDRRIITVNERPQPIYLLLNKPKGVVSTCSDPQNRRSVLDLLPNNLKTGQGIHPVGRLDNDSSGALLLTNDGELTLTLTHPRYHLPKTYRVWLDGNPTAADLTRWRNGIELDGSKTLPAQIKILDRQQQQSLLEIVLTEGKNRQIRRVAEILGYKVLKLHRTAIGSIRLESNSSSRLARGDYRHLTTAEISFLKNRCESNSKSNSFKPTALSKGAVLYGRQ
jgi:23S rRNA pseudouridine2605 synthase